MIAFNIQSISPQLDRSAAYNNALSALRTLQARDDMSFDLSAAINLQQAMSALLSARKASEQGFPHAAIEMLATARQHVVLARETCAL